MKFGRIFKTAVGYVWRLPLCAFAYIAGTMAGGALVSALGMKLPSIPEQANEETMGLYLLIGSFVLAIGVGPLARTIRAKYLVRCLILAGLTYVCLGVNTPVEAAIFTNIGGMQTMVVFSILPCLMFACVTALLFKPAGKGESFSLLVSRFFSGRSSGEWAWRFVAAVCAFPVIYWTFGMMVAPWVIEYYKQGQFGLTLPGTGVIVLVQLLRSSLFFLAAIPILIVSSGSRLKLTVRLGFAFFVLVGLFGMIQAYWLAPVLLVVHSVEILVDSVVYAGVLSLLFVRKDGPEFAATGNLAMA
ncbi:MAG TPA: hypothetical protein VMW72_00780 [Sedimentisphaerales bacterium]|nr:hypothetical protein [Sedimentisphaerales bacterium]